MTKTLRAKAPEGYRGQLIVTITTERGNYFSLTGEISTPWQRQECRAEVCGRIHEIILGAFPQLRPIALLHLADVETGEPLQALENGYYWLAGALGGLDDEYHGSSGASGNTPEECMEFLCNHLRVTTDQGEAIAKRVSFTEGPFASGYDKRQAHRAVFSACVDELREQWKTQAREGRELIASLK